MSMLKNYDMEEKLRLIEKVINKGPYTDTWESLSAYRVPAWYEKLKFGIFIHYGVFTVPEYDNEWYSRNMYEKDSDAYKHHIKTYGKHTEFGYKDFIPMFKSEKFDASKWVQTFKEAGAEYVIPVAEHHDGFQMYDSDLSSYNAADMGPCMDYLGLMKSACEKEGLIFGTSSHRIEHYFFQGDGRDFDSDIKGEFKRGDLYWPSVKGPKNLEAADGECAPSEEFMQDWLVRCCEIVDKYKPNIIYFDWWIQRVELRGYLRKFMADFYNRACEWGREVVINYKHNAIPFGLAVPDIERGQLSSQKSYKWQSDTSMCFNSWCYTKQNKYKKAKDIICDLIDIVSKNGTMLLNIGPKADGSFSDEETQILREIGKWLKVNHEAIITAGPYRIFGEGPTNVTEGFFQDASVKNFSSSDFRFTAGNGKLYIIALRAATDGKYSIKSFAKKQGAYDGKIKRITALEKGEDVKFIHDGDALKINYKTDSEYPVVFRLDVE